MSTLPWKRAIIVGASSGIGEAMARQLIAAGCDTAILARRADSLNAITADLQGKPGAGKIFVQTHDVEKEPDKAAALLADLTGKLGGLDLIVYAAGVLIDMPEGQDNLAAGRAMVAVNLVGALAWLGPASDRFGRQGSGTLVGISSIAGDRGRTANPVYGTTKAALNTYLEAIRNRVARKGVTVVTVKPGFIDTAMTKGKPGLFWLISADEAGRMILQGAAKKKEDFYVPGRWALVGLVIRNIPSFIFRRLNV